MATLFVTTIAACGSDQGVGASQPPSSPVVDGLKTSPYPKDWLTYNAFDPTGPYAEGIDTTGLLQLAADAPPGYDAGKPYGSCTVIYAASTITEGSDKRTRFEVVIKPTDGSRRGWHNVGLAPSDVDSWIAGYAQDCNV